MRKLPRPIAPRDSLLADPAFAEVAAAASVIRLQKGATLYRAGEPSAALYEIAHGGIRTVLPLPDGGRTVTGFRGAGDVLGLGAAGLHAESAEALAPSVVYALQHEPLMRTLRRSGVAACRILELAYADFEARARQVALLSRKDALGRIALFVRTMQTSDSEGDSVRLVMNRTDIAHYVGLSTEAVSRAFRALLERGIVRFKSRRRLDIIDAAGLDALIAHRVRRPRGKASAAAAD